MKQFKKTILKPGVYSVNTPGGRKMTPISSEYITKTCNTANAMLEKGLRIPAPFAHKDDAGIYPGPLSDIDSQEVDAKTQKKKRWSSDINGGFWNKFEVSDEGELVGYVETSDEAGEKVGTTVQETSVFVIPEWEDGTGYKWENALYHVAMVTNPIEPNQDNFEKMEEQPELAMAMAFSMSDEVGVDPSNKIAETLSLLKDKLLIELPGDTNPDNFFDRLVVVLLNIPQKEEEDITTPTKGSTVESSPVIMSENNQDNLVEIQTQAGNLLTQLVDQLKSNLKSRVSSMVEKGKIGKAYVEKTLTPQIEGLTMSFDELDAEGNMPKTALEMSLDVLDSNEALVGPTEGTKEKVGDAPEETAEMKGEEDSHLTEAEMNEVYAGFM